MGLFGSFPIRCRFHLEIIVFVSFLFVLDLVNSSISPKKSSMNVIETPKLISNREPALEQVESGSVDIRGVRGVASHESRSACDECEKKAGEAVPFYCSIKPDLDQCHKPICPKDCEENGATSSISIKVPPKKLPYPHPVNLPSIPASLLPPLPFVSPKSDNTQLATVAEGLSDSGIEVPAAGFPEGRSLDAQSETELPTSSIPKILDKLDKKDLRNLLFLLSDVELEKVFKKFGWIPAASEISVYLDYLKREEMLNLFHKIPMQDVKKLMSSLALSEVPPVIDALPRTELQKVLHGLPLFELRRVLEELDLHEIRKVAYQISPFEIQKVLSTLELPELPKNFDSLPVSEIPRVVDKLHFMDIRKVMDAIPLAEVQNVMEEMGAEDIRKFLHALPVHHVKNVLGGLSPLKLDNLEEEPSESHGRFLGTQQQPPTHRKEKEWEELGLLGGKGKLKRRPPPIPPPSETAFGRALEGAAEETFTPYNAETCELNSPNLVRLKADSKYIEYRPNNNRLQIRDIYKAAQSFGLVLAEFRYPTEWHAIEKSPVLKTVSDYKLTEKEPKIFYAIGADDDGKEEGDFRYPTDNTSLTFHVLNPAVFGRTDERCAVITSRLGSDKKHYLTTRLWHCDKNLDDKKKVVYGLFMFPPGSLCSRRSAEECTMLKNHISGVKNGKKFHHLIEMGQTRKRFIYFFSDQRSWSDARELCKAKGLTFLDLDPLWDDAPTVVEIIERFLKTTRLSPSTMFWTAGRYDDQGWSDNKFRWDTTKTYIHNRYMNEPAPYIFAFWDSQTGSKKNPAANLARRVNIQKPCVAMALNPETGGERPKLNFKVWYCNFPMFPLCHKKIEDKGPTDAPAPPSKLGSRPTPAEDSCEKVPPPTTTTTPKPTTEASTTTTTPPPPPYFIPVNPNTCKSESLLVRVISPKSKYVAYEPTNTSFSIEEIKSHCIKFGLIPAEVRSPEDWESIRKSGIDGLIQGDPGATKDFFYAIGMDDSEEKGKIRYNSDDGELLFSMFNPEADTYLEMRCTILDSVPAPDGSKGLMMLYDRCDSGQMSAEKIAYGLCMFPRDSKCFIESKEEKATSSDKKMLTTIIDLGITKTRSLFFSPHQRSWEGAKEYCEHAKLKLLDFDSRWGDTQEVLKYFTAKIVRELDQFQLTPIWTSGRLDGNFKDKKGTWATGGQELEFPAGGGADFKWHRLNDPELGKIREGSITNPCVEVSFDDVKKKAIFRPEYCYLPKYFLCYRKHKGRVGDPDPVNTLGITTIEL